MSMAGRIVRDARRRAGLSQRALAAKAGFAQESIARIETGRMDPRVDTLDRLLEACDLGVEVVPRLGRGVDRTQIQGLLALTRNERLARAIEVDRAHVAFRSTLRRIAE